jgi:hypothetical protein
VVEPESEQVLEPEPESEQVLEPEPVPVPVVEQPKKKTVVKKATEPSTAEAPVKKKVARKKA